MDDTLLVLAALAAELGEDEVAADAGELADRVAAGRFFAACVGQFKRGKSTLLNALLGQPLLPMGVVPVTSAITTVQYSEEETARVRFDGGIVQAIGLHDIAAYVTEDGNPGNMKRVRAVEVAVPAAILRGGLCLVDTPGIGSVFGASTQATREFVPRIDAALLVIGADPPISGDELALVADVAQETRAIIVALNKADRLDAAARREACQFARRVMAERVGLHIERIFDVSATRALAGGHDEEWRALEDALRELTASRERVLSTRASHRAGRLRAALTAALDEHCRALTRPIADAEQRIADLTAALRRAEQSLGDLSALLASEEARLVRALDAHRATFLEKAQRLAAERLRDRLTSLEHTRKPHEDALDAGAAIARDAVSSWGSAVEREVACLYERSMARFVELAGEFLVRTATAAGDAFRDVPWTFDADVQLDAPPRFYFTEMLSSTGTSPLGWLLGWVLPASVQRQRAGNRAASYVERVLDTNASRFTNDLIERVRQSRLGLEARVRHVLEDVVRRASGAVAAARVAQAGGQDRVQAELRRLADIRERLMALGPGTDGGGDHG